MEITVNRLDIKNAVERIIAAVPRKVSTPILSHIRLDAVKGGGLQLEATDLRVHAMIECRAEIETPGSCAVPADKIHGIIDGADSEYITMSLADNMTMAISGNSRKFTVSCLEGYEFPVYPNKPAITLQLPHSLLPDTIAAVAHASGTDETKPHLCGIYFVGEGNRLTAVATDGHRMSLASRETRDIDREIPQGITIPTQACRLISGISAAIDYRPSADGNNIHLDGGGLGMSIRLLEGKFPRFRNVIPVDLENSFIVSACDLISAIEACGVMIEGTTKAISISVANDQLTVSALSVIGIATATIPAMGDAGLEVKVNSRYLLQAIKSLGGEIFVKYKDAASPIMLIPVDHGPWDERIEILMPLRI